MTFEGGYEDKHLQFSSIQNVDTGKTFDIFILYIATRVKWSKQEEKEVSWNIFQTIAHQIHSHE